MVKNKNNQIVIKTGHTFEEYSKYFGRLYKKGKVLSFLESEKSYMNPKRQYWLIEDKNGEDQYYELPYYINKNCKDVKKSFRRKIRVRPVKITCLTIGSICLALGSVLAINAIYTAAHRIDYNRIPQAGLANLEEKVKQYQDWLAAHPGADATDKEQDGFDPYELAQVAMGNTLYDPTKPILSADGDSSVHYERRPLLVVSYGGSKINFGMEMAIDIYNATVTDGTKMMEESMSLGNFNIGKRDFYDKSTNNVVSNTATIKTNVQPHVLDKWNSDYITRTKDEYQEEIGKDPFDPFLYDIAMESVKDQDGEEVTTAKKDDDGGYTIHLVLNKENGVKRYVKRIAYMSPLPNTCVSRFEYVNLTFKTDGNLRVISSHAEEKYYMGMYDGPILHEVASTEANLSGDFYYDNVPIVPDALTPFDYSNYPKK